MARGNFPLSLRTSALLALTVFSVMLSVGRAYSGISTTVPISAELGSNIARQLFPLTLKLQQGNLQLTNPAIVFIDSKRIGLQVRFQAYDHRPTQNIARSEMGQAQISGALDFDPVTRQILLHAPNIDSLEFDRDSDTTRQVYQEIQAAWATQVANPIRSDIPPHPYLAPFRKYINDISYNGRSIILKIIYK